MTSNKESILRKIAALRAKTEEAGATESEALLAAEKAAELMAAYEIAESELEAAGDRDKPQYGRKFTDCANGSRFHAAFSCGKAIAEFTQTRAIGSRHESKFDGPVIAFVGDRPDVEFAVFLLDTIRRAMDSEYERFYRSGVGRGAKKSFQLGMAFRISERLRALVADRQKARTSDCRALVVTKSAEVNKVFKHLYPHTRKVSSRGGSNAGAYGAGKRAGDRVGFGRPIGGNASGPAMIGR